MPTTRQPLILAICPTTCPTAPAAPRDDHRLAGFRLADLEQAKVGGHAGHAERAEIHGQRREARVDLGHAALPVATAYSCTPKRAVDVVAHRESGIVCEAITRPTPPARITSPMPTGGM